MAVVLLAEDLKHRRRVAIKVLHPELSSSLGSERFLREITLAARLSHPNILALYDSGEVDGLLYYVMPYVQGETLRERIDREGALSAEETLTILHDVAEALGHAHAEGIIHRDIKPENILLSGGHAIVSDFGIARAVDAAGGERLTATGLAIGTPAYMSPEQASGVRAVDARSDVYSLACVAYEMLGGDPPFTGGSPQAVMARHALDAPLPLRSVRPTVSEAMDVVLAKALAKVPGDRFATPVQLVDALGRAHTTGGVRLRWRPMLWARQRSHRLTAAIAIIAVAALAAILTRQWLTARAARVTSIAVLPFENLSGDTAQEYFARGMHDALRGAIGQVGTLRVLWSSTNQYRNSTKADTTIARELHVDALVRASVVHTSDSVHLQLRLIQARPAVRLLWSQAYDRDVRGVLAMHNEAAHAIARTVAAELPGARIRPRAVNPESYEAYLRGMSYITIPQPDSQKKGVAYLQEAIDKNVGDPLAYAGLANVYARSAHSPFPLPDALVVGRAAALRAVALDSTLAEGWAALALVKLYLEWDWAGAERAFRRAIDLNPNLAEIRWHYSWYLVLFDRIDEAIVEGKRAEELDPFNLVSSSDLANLYTMVGRYDEAIAKARKLLATPARRSEGYAKALDALAGALAGKGRYDEAILAADSSRKLNPGLSFKLAYILGQAGRTDEARRVLDQFERLPITPIGALNRALMHGLLGDNDEFFRWIDYEPHHAWVPWIRVIPGLAPPSIRKDPRFQVEMRRMNLPMPRIAEH
jgi:serine/threonine-protein kinase